jgi:hypothetical protein
MNQNRPGSKIHVVEGCPQINSAAGASGGPSLVKYLFLNAISSGENNSFFRHVGFWEEFKLVTSFFLFSEHEFLLNHV